MVQTLLKLWASARVVTFEIAGASAVVAGVGQLFGEGAAWTAVGVALLAKSLQLDLERPER